MLVSSLFSSRYPPCWLDSEWFPGDEATLEVKSETNIRTTFQRRDSRDDLHRRASSLPLSSMAQTAEDSEEWCVLRTAHDDESIVRPFAFHRERSEAFDDQFTVFSQKFIAQHSKNCSIIKIHFWNDYQLFLNAGIKILGQ